MKNRILTFVIGILVGSIIATAGFLMFSKTTNKNMNLNERMPMEPNGQMQIPDGNMEELPEKPQGYFGGQMQNNNIQ